MNKQQNKPKLRWSMLAPENIELGQLYAFTLNIKEECETLKEEYAHYLYIISLLLKPYCEFAMNFEFSCIGKLHIHGTIQFHDYTDIGRFYYKFGKLKNRFAAELDTIETLQTWEDYCNKQANVFSEGLLPNSGIICNKDMMGNEYKSPKLRDQVEDSFFESHLDD